MATHITLDTTRYQFIINSRTQPDEPIRANFVSLTLLRADKFSGIFF